MINDDPEKNRLFETVDRSSRSVGQYLKLLLIVAGGILVVAAILFYLTLPAVGDKVKAPAGLEDRIRDHLLTKEKRTATDMAVYYCGKFYWAAVDVETRPDIPGAPINRISLYRVTAVQDASGEWTLTAAPVEGKDAGVPCS